MKKLIYRFVFFSCVISLFGCSVGKMFPPPDHGHLTLGKTTREQVVEMLGKPNKDFAASFNGEDMKILQYYYVPGHRDLSTGVSPATTMFLYLWQDKLVRYEYTSTESATSTDFNTDLVKQIVKGSTTRDQVVGLIGEPGGYAIFPGIPERDVTAVVYFCEITTGLIIGGTNIHRKVLVLPFDNDGVILDVQLTETGKPTF